jgi:hypothetical protein
LPGHLREDRRRVWTLHADGFGRWPNCVSASRKTVKGSAVAILKSRVKTPTNPDARSTAIAISEIADVHVGMTMDEQVVQFR